MSLPHVLHKYYSYVRREHIGVIKVPLCVHGTKLDKLQSTLEFRYNALRCGGFLVSMLGSAGPMRSLIDFS